MTLAFKEPHGPFSYFDPNVPDLMNLYPFHDRRLVRKKTFNRSPISSEAHLTQIGYRNRLSLGPESQKEKQTAYRLISRADTAVGEILNALESLNLSKIPL